MRQSRQRGLKVLAPIFVLALFAAACGDDAAGPTTTSSAGTTTSGAGTTTTGAGGTTTTAATGKGGQVVNPPLVTTGTQAGGSIVFGADQEPAILNTLLSDGNLFANSMIAKGVLPAMVVVQPDFSLEPYVAEALPTVDSTSPFTVTWRIKAAAKWSDGTDITADDVKATTDYVNNPDTDVTDRTGVEYVEQWPDSQNPRITSFVINNPKSFTVTWDKVYAPYQYLWSVSGAIYQKAALDAAAAAGTDVNDFMKDDMPFSAGPFRFDSFTRGDNITLVKNDAFWGEQQPSLDRIIFKFIEDSQAQVQAVEAQDVDVIYPQPQLAFIDQANKIEFANYQVSLGTVWEHLDFNLGKVPQLADINVRKAIAHAIDRKTIIDTIIQPLVGDQVVPPLGSVAYVPNQDEYQDHFAQYNFDPAKALSLLEEAGWTVGTDGVREKDGLRLSFTYATTTGNLGRELQQQLIQQQLLAVGIEIKPANRPAAELFSEAVLTSGNFELINFAYVASPDPGGTPPVFRADKCPDSVPGCTSADGQNYIQYNNEQVTELLIASDAEADPTARAALINEANKLIGDDVPVLPLYQKPTFALYNSRLVNVIDNPTQEGPMWNSAFWAVTG